MIEYNIIKILLKKDFHLQYYNLVLSLITDASLKKLVYALDEMHKSLESDGTLEELRIVFYTNYPALKDAEKQVYEAVFKRINEADADETIITEYLSKMREKSFAHRMAVELLEVEAGNKPISSVLDAIKTFSDTNLSTEEFKFVTTRLSDLVAKQYLEKGLSWRLNCLNQSLGSLRKGDFGFFFARKEVGKTTFICSEGTSLLEQMLSRPDGYYHHFNNEEQGDKVMLRYYSAYFGLPLKDIMLKLDYYEKKFESLTDGRFLMTDMSDISMKYVEKVLQKYPAGMIWFDQLDKISGADTNLRDNLRYGAVYRWAREIAKEYSPVIAATQADGTAEGVKWLNMGHVANAKTDKQAEADFIIGIGRTHDEGFEYMRYINILANKLIGDDGVDQSMKHGKFEVIIEPQIARYKDINFS